MRMFVYVAAECVAWNVPLSANNCFNTNQSVHKKEIGGKYKGYI